MTLASLGVTPGHVAAFGWIAAAWLLIIAVVGAWLLGRWKARERRDAAATEAALRSLGHTIITDHSQDIV